MKAVERELLSVLGDNTIRFVVPVFQRSYAWEKKNWDRLWNDILELANNPEREHFTGSIAWVGKMKGPGKDIEGNVLVDGQQRLATLSLIILAFAEYLKKHGNKDAKGNELPVTFEKIVHAGYLLSTVDKGEERYKLTLSDLDRDVFRALVEKLVDPATPLPQAAESSRLVMALNHFRAKIAAMDDPASLWNGLQRLNIVNVMLEPGKDNPQLVFETMNATGKPLEKADLIRNYLLLGLSIDEQTRLYHHYWRQIELILDTANSLDNFDRFFFHYLTVKHAPKIILHGNIYQEFRRFKEDSDQNAEEIPQDLLFHADLYSRISSMRPDPSAELEDAFRTFKIIEADPVLPLLLFLYVKNQTDPEHVPDAELLQCVKLLESFIVYRTLCDAPSNTLNKIVPVLVARLREKLSENDFNVYKRLTASLEEGKGTSREYPDAEKVVEVLQRRNFYSMKRNRQKFFFEKLENSRHKNKFDIMDGLYTIEHVMPREIDPATDWPEMLGDGYEEKRKEYLHLLGNLTVTAYNSEMGNISFALKKSRYLATEPLALLEDIKNADKWDFNAILRRTTWLAGELAALWPKPEITEEEVRQLALLQSKSIDSPKSTNLKYYIDMGILQPGDKLSISQDSQYSGVCRLTEDGWLEFENGLLADTPGAAVGYIMKIKKLPHKNINGWAIWKVDRLGCRLNELKNFKSLDEE